jgi:hypothetical protein
MRRSDGATVGSRCAAEGVIPADEDGVGAEGERTCEVNGVVSAKRVCVGELSGLRGEMLVHGYEKELALHGFEVPYGLRVLSRGQPAGAPCGRERGAAFRIREHAGGGRGS